MYCSQCGSKIGENVNFCSKCGNKIVITCLNCGNKFSPGDAFQGLSQSDINEIIEELKRGKLGAVKLYKDKTNASLKASKEYVDELAKKYDVKSGGCMSVILFVLIFSIIIISLL